jgi:hypothetical protein
MRILFVILFLALSVSAKFTVKVQIDGEKELTEVVQSYLERELRSLGDVEVTDSLSADFIIKGSVLEAYNANNTPLGYSLMTVFLSKATCVGDKSNFPCHLLVDYEHGVAGKTTLRKICENIITNFDTKLLKPFRKLIENKKKISQPTRID